MFSSGNIVDEDYSSIAIVVYVGLFHAGWCVRVDVKIKIHALHSRVELQNRMGCVRERLRQVDCVDSGNGCAGEQETGAAAGLGHGQATQNNA